MLGRSTHAAAILVASTVTQMYNMLSTSMVLPRLLRPPTLEDGGRGLGYNCIDMYARLVRSPTSHASDKNAEHDKKHEEDVVPDRFAAATITLPT